MSLHSLFLPLCFMIVQEPSITSLSDQSSSVFLVTDFEIEIISNNEEISMSCNYGCAWKKLSFSLEQGEEKVIDEYGMNSLELVLRVEEPDLADFLFLIGKRNNMIYYKGKEGTNWVEVTYSYSS